LPIKKNILICPLNWGLGHATRCIPIINILIQEGHHVIIGAGGAAMTLLKKVFPENKCIEFDDYNISYSKGKHLVRKIVIQIPKILFRIWSEHYKLKKIIKHYQIDVVISDNRFGLWNRNVRTIYITHQLFIKSTNGNSLFEYLLRIIHRYFILKYDVCWIPDLAGDFKLSGELSGKYPAPSNARFIGVLSDFYGSKPQDKTNYDICALVSGPEPQRTMFQNILIGQLKQTDKKTVVILGQPSEKINKTEHKNITVFNYLQPSDIQEYFMRSVVVIARSGYSTIMDLAATGKRAILVPTPGQPEQEYLAAYLSEKKLFYSVAQNCFNLDDVLNNTAAYPGIMISRNESLLKEEILSAI